VIQSNYDISFADIGGVDMSVDKVSKEYLPMSESAYYILLSLNKPRHGYGIIKNVEKITEGRIRLGAGTIYGTMTRFENDKLITPVGEEERRKLFVLTALGRELLQLEIQRLGELLENGNVYGEVQK
jgi:DNA-binding PadR family transcriptional regulator